jgi:hypothetical protein
MMIELGEADVFKGQVAEAVECIVDSHAAFAHFVEQHFDLRAIHQSSFAASAAAAKMRMASCITCLSGKRMLRGDGCGNLHIRATHWRLRPRASARF